MNHTTRKTRILAPLLALALLCSLCVPASAFFWSKKDNAPYVQDFSKNGLIGSIIAFDPEDFQVKTDNKAKLTTITIDTLPDAGAGTLVIGGQPVAADAEIDSTALGGLRFQSAQSPTVTTTTFTFTPHFSSAQDANVCTVTLYLLSQTKQTPIARNMDLATYKDIAITGYFDAMDADGDALTFQLSSTPARGAVSIAQDGSSEFVYTPYEGKTGRDTFRYVAIDTAGNTSNEAIVTIQIDKPSTKVTYADLGGDPAHKAAIRMAEQDIYVGQCVNGSYFFDANAPVSRAEFLSMAMAVSGLTPLENITTTGFYDDESIPSWARGSVSAALKAGTIQGSRDDTGAPVFGAQEPISCGEATVMLNNLLNLTDVPAEVFFSSSEPHWASQAAANITACGILPSGGASAPSLTSSLTRGEVAQMLDGAMDVVDARSAGSWLPWK